ncbi:unnamed protein product [Mytilus coruscus]|uniref:MYND-type domain-containing protein n=1 Tax=Mytilus coruscus TaxID=42192 RepID=A0A6J8AAH9_MYTCO|nr:unnamed protein product [Mytilus coruscus]
MTKKNAIRVGHRGATRRLISKIEEELDKETTQRNEIESLCEILKKKRDILSELDSEILEEIAEENMDAELQDSDRPDMDSQEEADHAYSKCLDNILNIIGVKAFRKACQRLYMLVEILNIFRNDKVIEYIMGSTSEGTSTPGMIVDTDLLYCDESIHVIEDLSFVVSNENSEWQLEMPFVIENSRSHAGYVTLQLYKDGVPCLASIFPLDKDIFPLKRGRNDRLFLIESVQLMDPPMARAKNKPAMTRIYNKYDVCDLVGCYRCRTWPTIAREWLSRNRLYGWPPKDMIQELKSLGFFVVKKGHPFSSEADFEWRISLNLQERKLIYNLTDTQHKCYIILKMINNEFVHSDCITTYHWKTCLFYVIEENPQSIWIQKRLYYCVELCMKQMLVWVENEFCPDYFIPKQNLFDGRLSKETKLVAKQILEILLEGGVGCLMYVDIDNISNYFESRGCVETLHKLHANSQKIYKKKVHEIYKLLIYRVLSTLNLSIIGGAERNCNGNINHLIETFWGMLHKIQHTNTITEHTKEDTQCVLSLLTTHIYTCLTSNIAAMAIQHENPQVRDFLLFGSCMYLMKGDLSGKLKFITVLYAAGLYKDCEWFIDQLDETCIKEDPSFCGCIHAFNDSEPNTSYINFCDTFKLEVSTCVFFLRTELPIIPDALHYEMFRYFGISLPKSKRGKQTCQWRYRAVVDGNIYFFILKYMIKKKLEKAQEYNKALRNCWDLAEHRKNVNHRDVAWNLLVWCFCAEKQTHSALTCLGRSLKLMDSFEIMPVIYIGEDSKWLRDQFNSVKLHAIVIMYKTWFARELTSNTFCFQCLSDIMYNREKLKKCSSCNIATFCSEQCQKINWKIHETVCKIVRMFKTV